ncbi:putative DNA excision/repair protein SNF2 [Leishmania mexicana MHOM/GT/2001/U1103]|uniref:DNA excision/repair protein SNF2 n=1 Tax=Leishmania mexicana (strain MHOM/GT/2001/U1103) TaxID=929439 RepID=E9AJB0_LEIMU|nr:putative DNA excision/repair protein SNF2 [Leishmania mexicana MHOM/GT/2001/U1103]CBZ23007.1 putative DNA excision/repair protein SNF2 [Leishmania mexicana MHOM/GT/2001/U1103]
MEHDDLLDDLLSWTPPAPRGKVAKSSSCITTAATTSSPSTSPHVVSRQPRAGSLQEACVNTAAATTKAGSVCANHCHRSASDADDEQKARCAASASAETSPLPPTSGPPFSLPPDVDARLYPHQRAGVQWLYSRHCKSRACLLADEMGLGKTVQVAAFLGQLYARQMIKTTILVVPPTLVAIWTAAFAEWGGASLTRVVEVIHNEPRKKRQARWRKLRYGLPCVLLTTYGVLRQDAADMGATLVDYVVLDEAHLIKDPNTCVFRSALTLSARHKIALTGTPLMNTFDDMWSVFRFLDGSILDMDKPNFNAVSATLLRGNERDASAAQREVASSELAKLQAAIRPFMLRREKKDVAAQVLSSEKEDVVVWVRLTDVQRQLYAAVLSSKELASAREGAADVDVTEGTADEGGVVMERSSLGGDGSSAAVATVPTNPLLLLTMLSQICNHPWLSLLDETVAAALSHNPYKAPVAEIGDIFGGAKLWVALQLLLRCVSEQRKTLVFSRSKSLLHLLSFLLREWRLTHTQVDGDTPSERRCAEVERFNKDAGVWVCLLTTQVGGVGLTFNAASAVVLLDPSWNPSADAQAVDRVHRIGQRRDVVVFRLVTCGTVEEKVYRNQIFKRMAALQSMKGGDDGGGGEGSRPLTPDAGGELYRYFTRLQLRNMFDMDDGEQRSTAEQLELLHPGRVRGQLREELRRIDGVYDVSDNACVLTEAVDADGAGRDEAQTLACSPSASPERTWRAGSVSPPPSQASPSQQALVRVRSRSDGAGGDNDAHRRRRVDAEDTLATVHVATEGCGASANSGEAFDAGARMAMPATCTVAVLQGSQHLSNSPSSSLRSASSATMTAPLSRFDGCASASLAAPRPTEVAVGDDAEVVQLPLSLLSESLEHADDAVSSARAAAAAAVARGRASDGCSSADFASCRSSF